MRRDTLICAANSTSSVGADDLDGQIDLPPEPRTARDMNPDRRLAKPGFAQIQICIAAIEATAFCLDPVSTQLEHDIERSEALAAQRPA